MTPYYPARHGYPSLFESEGNAGAGVGEKRLHRSFVDRLLANQFPVPRKPLRPFNSFAPLSGFGQGPGGCQRGRAG
jgi:hypothetical protein